MSHTGKMKLVLGLKINAKGSSYQGRFTHKGENITVFIQCDESGNISHYESKDGTKLVYGQMFAFDQKDNNNSFKK